MSKITALLQKMKSLCNSNNGKDTFNSPVTAEEISDWEIAHNVKLCDELKEFYLFSNGMNLRIRTSLFFSFHFLYSIFSSRCSSSLSISSVSEHLVISASPSNIQQT